MPERARSSPDCQRYRRLVQYGIATDEIRPNGVYAPAMAVESMVYSAGQVSRLGSAVFTAHPLRKNDLEEMRVAARAAAGRAVAAMAGVVDLDAIKQIVSMTGYIACAADFVGHSMVLDAASEILLDVFGPSTGRHVRTAVGVVSLPGGGLVEVQITASLDRRG